MEIKSSMIDTFIKMFGISRRERELKFRRLDKTNKLNKFLRNRQRRLLSLQGGKFIKLNESGWDIWKIPSHLYQENNKAYWEEGRKLLLSTTYQLYHLNRMEKNFGRKFSYKKLCILFSGINLRARDLTIRPKLKRKWIQAPKGKARGLTIPSYVDRWFGSMWTGLLENYLITTLGKEQHAFMQLKGTSTAWRDLWHKLNKYDNFYEFDLANFFPSVSHSVLDTCMELSGIPYWVRKYLLTSCSVIPKLDLDYEVIDYQTGGSTIHFRNILDLLTRKGETHFTRERTENPSFGVPMGMGYSPLLACLVLRFVSHDWLRKDPMNRTNVLYADDGGLMWRGMEDKLNGMLTPIKDWKDSCKKFNIEINEKKSHLLMECVEMINRHSDSDVTVYIPKIEWYGKLKFLGLVYDPYTRILNASTRKGSILSLDLTAAQFWFGDTLIETLPNFFVNCHYGKLYEEIEVNYVKPTFDYKSVFDNYLKKFVDVKVVTSRNQYASDWLVMGKTWISKSWNTEKVLGKASNSLINKIREELMLKLFWKDGQTVRDLIYNWRNNSWDLFNTDLETFVVRLKEFSSVKFFELIEMLENSWRIVYFVLNVQNVIYSKYWGLIQSRLYIGSWNSPIIQNFSLEYSPDSLLGELFRNARTNHDDFIKWQIEVWNEVKYPDLILYSLSNNTSYVLVELFKRFWNNPRFKGGKVLSTREVRKYFEWREKNKGNRKVHLAKAFWGIGEKVIERPNNWIWFETSSTKQGGSLDNLAQEMMNKYLSKPK